LIAITNLFQRGVAGPLADAVDGAFNCRAPPAIPARIGHRHAEGRYGNARRKIALSELGTRSIKVRMKWVYSSGVVCPRYGNIDRVARP